MFSAPDGAKLKKLGCQLVLDSPGDERSCVSLRLIMTTAPAPSHLLLEEGSNRGPLQTNLTDFREAEGISSKGVLAA